MHFFQLISLFSWSVACSSVIQGEYHVFIANVSNTHANVSVNANVSTNANISTAANPLVQNLTDGVTPKSLAATVQNLQTFTGALANVQAPPILMSNVQGRPFMVQSDTFPDFPTAGSRTCDTQYAGCAAVGQPNRGYRAKFPITDHDQQAANKKNSRAGPGPKGDPKGPKDNMALIRAVVRAVGEPKDSGSERPPKGDADAAVSNDNAPTANASGNSNAAANANAGPNRGSGISIADCEAQRAACNTAQKNAPFQSFNLENVGPDPAMPDFDLLCAP